MKSPATRRDFLNVSAGLVGSALVSPALAKPLASPIEVVVWDERQPAQKQAYGNFLGNAIARHLTDLGGFSVKSVALDDPNQGLGKDVLDKAQVLIWWGHVRHAEITPETGRAIVERIKSGQLSLIALHSAHWSTPFMEAMNERSRKDLKNRLSGAKSVEVVEVPPPQRSTVPKVETRLTPYSEIKKFPNGSAKAELHLPYCCFPSYRNDGKPSYINILKPSHPIAEGIPASFEIDREEMYCEPFHVPEPDEVILEERWATGEWFRSGMIWNIGKGKVFYFRPGHETYPTYQRVEPLKIVANAARWLGGV